MNAVTMFLVVVSLLAFIGWLEWTHAKERRYLINCLIAKTPNDVRLLNQIDPPYPSEPMVRGDDFFDDPDFAEGFTGQSGI